jgi:iron complex outermembrane receptor protein
MKKNLFLLFSLSIANFILAQTKDSTVYVSEVTIVGVSANQNTPVTKTDLSRNELIRTYQGQDLPVILTNTPSITFYSDGGNYNGYMYFRLRGVDQTRINMTLNGVPLNEPEDQGAYFSNYTDFFNNVSNVQIQRGIGTSSNGTASYIGSLNFKSINIVDTNYFNVNLGLGSFGTKRLSIANNTRISKKFGTYVRYSKTISGGYRDNSGTDADNLYVSANYSLNKHIFNFISFIGNSRNEMAYLASPESVIKTNRRHNPLKSNELDAFKQHFNQLQHTFKINDNKFITTSVFYTYLKGNYDIIFAPDMLNFQLNSDFYGIISNYTYKTDKTTFNAGISLNNYQRTHKMGIRPMETDVLYRNAGYKNEVSSFIKLERRIKNVVVYGDLQFRQSTFSYTTNNTTIPNTRPVTWNFINPKVGIGYNLTKKIYFYGFIGKMHREPTRNDMFAGFDDIDSSNFGLIGDFTKVKPETVTNSEIGLRYKTNNLTVNANVFNMDFRNEIAAIGQLSYIGLPLRKNVKSSNRKGIEIEGIYNVSNITLAANVTIMSSVIHEYYSDADSATYRNITPLLTPKVLATVNVGYVLKNFNLGGNIRYIGKSYLGNTNNLTLPAAIVGNLSLTYSVNANLLLIAQCNNVANSKYYNSGYVVAGERNFFVAPTRNFMFTINKTF